VTVTLTTHINIIIKNLNNVRFFLIKPFVSSQSPENEIIIQPQHKETESKVTNNLKISIISVKENQSIFKHIE
jgi:hypothetical protein